MLKFGFHMSIAGSIANAPREAALHGYPVFQMFTASSRSWSNPKIDSKAAAEFKGIVRKNSVEPFAHIPYLCNPGSPNEEVYAKSRKMLVDNMGNCKLLGIKYLVIHTGSHLGRGFDSIKDRLADTIIYALHENTSVKILLENSAGYKNSVGSHMKEIGSIIEMVGNSRVGACLDTCHALAAGYDIASKGGTKILMDDIEENIGIDKVKLVHLNDAKFPLGSGLDRHWHIGKGYIGIEGFANFFKGSRLTTDCFVMETPENNYGNDHINMQAVSKVMKACGIEGYAPKG
ncbi:MAG: deoxyribonuclease IV [Candidatus Micrarchaeia archaeon]